MRPSKTPTPGPTPHNEAGPAVQREKPAHVSPFEGMLDAEFNHATPPKRLPQVHGNEPRGALQANGVAFDPFKHVLDKFDRAHPVADQAQAPAPAKPFVAPELV